MHNQCYDLEQVDRYISLLQNFLATGCQDAGLLDSLRSRSEELLNAHDEFQRDSFSLIIGDITKMLAQPLFQRADEAQSEKGLLKLACDWLAQLLVLRHEGLPEPQSLLAEVRQLFTLSYAGHAAARCTENSSSDPFADDDNFDEAVRTAASADPFGEDPGLSAGLDRLQQTITHVKSAVAFRREVKDPFATDPGAVVESGSDGHGEEFSSGEKEEIDIFSDDPDFDID